MDRMYLLSFTRNELRSYLSGLGIEPFRADQLLNWVYKKGITRFEDMTNLPKSLREDFRSRFRVHTLRRLDRVEAPDAVKYVFETRDNHILETVLIRERDHLTLCVSSQIGCAVGCTFCATALDGLKRNLSVEEIIDQFLQVQSETEERIRNVVFMGMGEPLANYDNVKKACEIMVSSWGLDLSKRRVTISTSGLVAQLRRMAQDSFMRELNLAVSLNATDQTLRRELMPLTKTNTLGELISLLKSFPLSSYRRITLEYVLIRGVNDGIEDAQRLVSLIGRHRKRFKVNLIPFNPDPSLPYSRPEPERIYRFQRVLWENKISALIRFSKGADVFGACGQLRNRTMVKFKLHGKESQMGH